MIPFWLSPEAEHAPVSSGTTPGPTGLHDGADPTRPVFAGALPDRTPGSLGSSDAACALATGPLVLPEGDARSSAATPHEFMQRYRHLDVSYVARETGHVCQVEADVHVYVNNGLSNRRSNVDERSALQDIVRRTARQGRRDRSAIAAHRRAHNVAIAHSFYGKADPWEYRIYLAYALTYGRTTPASLSSYCDSTARLGVDCSGFVNSYLVSTGRTDRRQDIDDYARNAARSSYVEIRPMDLLIWGANDADADRHIAIVDHLIGPDQMQVVESSGSKGGLASSTYTVESVQDRVFRVDRGLNEDGERYRKSSAVKIVAYR